MVVNFAQVTVTLCLLVLTSVVALGTEKWTVIFSDDFSGGDEAFVKAWSVFSGNWYVKDGVLHQDHGGFDCGAVVRNLYLRCDYRIEARVRLIGGGAGTGLYWNVGDQHTGENGNMLRFDGNIPIMYGFMHGRGFLGSGGASGSLYADGTWHDIRMDVWNSRGTFDLYWDGTKVAEEAPMYHRGGYVGLQSSMGHSAFDDVRISVPPGADWQAIPSGKVMPEWVEAVTVLPDSSIAYPVKTLGVVQVVDSEGRLLREVGHGHLERPVSVASGANNDLYVIDGGRKAVVIFSGTSLSGTIPLADMSSPHGIAIDSNGNLWVSDFATGTVYRVTRDGIIERVLTRENGLHSPGHLSFSNGTLYIADGSGVWKFETALRRSVTRLDLGTNVRSVCAYSGGNLVVATGSDVRMYDASGRLLRSFQGDAIGGVYAYQVSVNSAGDIVAADRWNKRIVILSPQLVESRPQISRIGVNSATIRWLSDAPTPSRVMLLDTPVRATLPPATDYSSARSFGDGARRTDHEVVVSGLHPATRYTFAIASPVRTIPTGTYSVDYRFTTLPPRGMTMYTEVPVAVIAYAHVTFESQRDSAGNVPPPAVRDDNWFQYVKDVHEGMRLFYWSNSYFKLDPVCKYLKVDRPVDFAHLGSSSEEIYKDVVELARREGIQPTDFGGVIVIGGNCCYAYPWPTPWWGGKLTYAAGCCFAGGGDMWLSTHEFHHITEGWMNASRIRGYQSADVPWGLKGRFGENYDFLAHTLRVMPKESYYNLAFGKIVLAIDYDNDGVPDNEPRAPWDEKRAGTSPNTAYSYENGLTDLQNLTAGITTAAVRGHKHPLLTKQINLKYPFAVFDYDYERRKRTPKIDGKLEPKEWDVFASTPNAVTPYPAHSVYGRATRQRAASDYRMTTYLNWDDKALYVAARAPFKFLLSPQVDCNADGYFHGKDNIILNVQIPRDESTNKPYEVHGVPVVMVWNNVEPVRERGIPDWTNHLFDKVGDVKWAWGRDAEGWYCLEVAIPECEAVGLVPAHGKEMGIRLWVRAQLPAKNNDPDPGYAFELFDNCEYGYFKLVR